MVKIWQKRMYFEKIYFAWFPLTNTCVWSKYNTPFQLKCCYCYKQEITQELAEYETVESRSFFGRLLKSRANARTDEFSTLHLRQIKCPLSDFKGSEISVPSCFVFFFCTVNVFIEY